MKECCIEEGIRFFTRWSGESRKRLRCRGLEHLPEYLLKLAKLALEMEATT